MNRLMYEDFSDVIDSADVHRMLRECKEHPSGSCKEYLDEMHAIALQMKMEESTSTVYI